MVRASLSASLRLGALAVLAACTASPAVDSTPCAPRALPYEVHGHCVEPLAGGWLAFGGFHEGFYGGTNGSPRTHRLLAAGPAFEPRADLVAARAFARSCTFAGSVFAIGPDVERYDEAADRWEVLVPDGALPNSHFAAAAIGPTAFVLGGFPIERAGLHAVDLQSGAVRAETPPPSFEPGDHFHAMGVLDGALHVVGGLDGTTFEPQRAHWRRESDGTWTARCDAPAPVWTKFSITGVVDGRLFVFGESGAFAYDPRTNAWTTCAPAPRAVVVPAVVARGHELWVVGGTDLAQEGARVLLCYDARADRWTSF